MKHLENVKGTRDFLPEDLRKRRFVEEKIKECFRAYSYEEIETPIIEFRELFDARSGEEIRHRMYSFCDLGGNEIVLRPEMTAPVARLVASKLKSEPKPIRLCYIANCFRYDNPQFGRYREFWQAGFELFGALDIESDAEILIIAIDIMRKIGFKNFYVKIGDVGLLRNIFESEGIGDDYQNKIMGLLDKNKIEMALEILKDSRFYKSHQYLESIIKLNGFDTYQVISEGRKIFNDNEKAIKILNRIENTLKLLNNSVMDVALQVDLGFARGLEYYTGLIFEIFIKGFDTALCGGGRYDKLVELFGGDPTPAVGFSLGIDRIVLAMENENLFPVQILPIFSILVIPIEESLYTEAFKISINLRQNGLAVQNYFFRKNIKEALSYSNKKGNDIVIIVGSKEFKRGCVIVRDMKAKEQKEVPLTNLIIEVKKLSQK